MSDADYADAFARLARRASAEPGYLGHAIAEYQRIHGLDDLDLAVALGVSADTLNHIRLCGAIRSDPATLDADAEKTATLGIARAVRDYLTSEGWPAPMLCDSGNGHHLLYRLAEPYPVTEETLPLTEDDVIRRVLLHLADRFGGAGGSIDTRVFNPARIVKFPGTLACKGEATEERPHRRARVLEVPTDGLS